MTDDIKQEDLINIRGMGSVKPSNGPKVDELVSKAIGKKVFTTNPTLIKKMAEWKKERGESDEPDNWMDDPKKVEELRKVL